MIGHDSDGEGDRVSLVREQARDVVKVSQEVRKELVCDIFPETVDVGES